MEQDVLGLDVAVDHAVLVGVLQRVGHLAGDAHRVLDGQLLLARQPVAQRLALDVGHDVEDQPVGLARVEQREDVRVLEVGGGLDLGQEPLGAEDGGQLGAQDLERDLAVVPHVVRQVHRGHAAGAQLALDDVAVGEGGGEAAEGVRHESS